MRNDLYGTGKRSRTGTTAVTQYCTELDTNKVYNYDTYSSIDLRLIQMHHLLLLTSSRASIPYSAAISTRQALLSKAKFLSIARAEGIMVKTKISDLPSLTCTCYVFKDDRAGRHGGHTHQSTWDSLGNGSQSVNSDT